MSRIERMLNTRSLLIALALSSLAACTDLQGSGVAADADLTVAPFHRIVVDNAIPVEVTLGAAAPVHVHGDDNIVPLVRAAVIAGELRIDLADAQNVAPREPLRITVRAPYLDAISARGASSVRAVNLVGDRVELAASGASSLVVTGAVTSARETASGASTIDADGLVSAEVHLDVSGASTSRAHASRVADGLVSGRSSAEVSGAPSTRSVEASGGSTVNYR
jgi:Putative auto-transporter adhesin, head GIN domain